MEEASRSSSVFTPAGRISTAPSPRRAGLGGDLTGKLAPRPSGPPGRPCGRSVRAVGPAWSSGSAERRPIVPRPEGRRNAGIRVMFDSLSKLTEWTSWDRPYSSATSFSRGRRCRRRTSASRCRPSSPPADSAKTIPWLKLVVIAPRRRSRKSSPWRRAGSGFTSVFRVSTSTWNLVTAWGCSIRFCADAGELGDDLDAVLLQFLPRPDPGEHQAASARRSRRHRGSPRGRPVPAGPGRPETYSTPTARPPSKRSRATWEPSFRVRFGRRRAGAR